MEHGFWEWPRLFIHIPKNAGTYIRALITETPHRHEALAAKIITAGAGNLRSPQYEAQMLATLAAQGDMQDVRHARWRDVGDLKRRHRAFAIVRNPWSRVVSRYLYLRKFQREKREPFASDPAYQFRSFRHFLEDRHVFGTREHYWLRAIRSWYPQREYVIDDHGRIVCDLLRQEHLTDELAAYFQVKLQVTIVNPTSADDYRRYYDAETAEIVARWYAADIATFGFQFDTAASRNTWATKGT